MSAWLPGLKLSAVIIVCCGLAVAGAIKLFELTGRRREDDENGPWGDV